ncbi:hypothetical protein LXT21_34095 [Myxococcus sp. K38C18041901]|uniref:hypothetical protein n=1 Tax=Myxococcus guangdongensis TaxID=2906760 RepID=UPI0020A7B6FC|nr:hypothetical protein [Myxococcus guangdongensis]MCP3063819.1 hypothetical protein [Myxococcus guangdongensis]
MLTGGVLAAQTVTALTNGVPLPNLVIKPGQPHVFTLEVPAGETEQLFEVSAPAAGTMTPSGASRDLAMFVESL